MKDQKNNTGSRLHEGDASRNATKPGISRRDLIQAGGLVAAAGIGGIASAAGADDPAGLVDGTITAPQRTTVVR